MKQSKAAKVKAGEFDKAFEEGDVSRHLDLKTLKIRHPVQRINIDIPQEILERVDQEAVRVGVPRTSLIKLWIVEHVDRLVHSQN